MFGTVEIDETYVGGKQRGKGFSGRASEATNAQSNKRVVIGLRQRGGKLRLVHAKDATSETIGTIIKEHVHPDVERVMTDEFRVYPKALIDAGVHGSKHKTIRHKEKVYVEGEVHTNTVENAFSLFKRGLVGSFHKVSIKHLNRYLSEFEYRFNNREAADLFSQMLQQMTKTGNLEFAELIAMKQ